ncbi:hypothetical protein Droror1_Dr00005932 [Drosera rotundifolia]
MKTTIFSLICQDKSHLNISSNTFSTSPEATPSVVSVALTWVSSGFGDYPLSPAKRVTSYAVVFNGSWSNSSGRTQGLFNFNENEKILGKEVKKLGRGEKRTLICVLVRRG